jgi:hypothetical protein
MRLWQAKSIGLDQQTGEAAGEVLHLTQFRPITEPSNAISSTVAGSPLLQQFEIAQSGPRARSEHMAA